MLKTQNKFQWLFYSLKKTKKIRKQKTTNKSKKNTIKQNVKINISTSGGSGGGGTSVPNIPTPVQSFARSEKIGENVNVSNLLNRIGNQQNQQTAAFTNFSNIINRTMTQKNQENEMIQQINRDDRIDIAEHVNDGIDNNENINDLEFVISPHFGFFDEEISKNIPIPIKTPSIDTSTQTLFERIHTQTEPELQPSPAPLQTTGKTLIETPEEENLNFIGEGGGGEAGQPSLSSSQEKKISIKQDTYISQAPSGAYIFKPPPGYKIDGQKQKTYQFKQQAIQARENFFKDNNFIVEIK